MHNIYTFQIISLGTVIAVLCMHISVLTISPLKPTHHPLVT